MDILNNFDINADFWEMNPQLSIPFKEVKKKYPKTSSKVMWSIALYADPNSKFSNTSNEYRRELIETDYFSEINWDSVEDFISLYKKLALTKAQRFLVEWEDKLEERSKFIASKDYNEETYEMLDKMMKDTDKMWAQYMKCLKDVEQEQTVETFGKAAESATEKGDI